MGFISGMRRCPGTRNGNPLQYPCLENIMDRGAYPWDHRESDMTEWAHTGLLMQDCHKPSICKKKKKKKKNAVSANRNNVKLSKMRYACIMVFDYTIEDNLHRNSIRGNIPNQRTMLKHWSLQNFLCFIFSFWPGCTLVGSWFPDQGLNLAPHLWKVPIPNHWTTWEFPRVLFFTSFNVKSNLWNYCRESFYSLIYVVMAHPTRCPIGRMLSIRLAQGRGIY